MEYSAVRRAGRTAGLVVTTAAILASYACRMHRNDSVSPVDTSVITESEIDSVHAFNAFDAVYRLRPRFLTSRGKVSLDPSVPPALPNVYVDEQFYGDVTTLRGIAASSIESIKFYDVGSAQYKFGHGNMAGVIGITTKH